MNKNDLLKEKVKARMLKNAARLWGAEDVDIELNFDPLVNILIEGCVNEIGKIGNEINNSHARVTNRLAQLLTPDVLTGSIPAHAVIHARANENIGELDNQTQFYFTKKAPSVSNPKMEVNKDVFFTPVSDVKIVNGTVKYFGVHGSLFQVSNVYQKNTFASAKPGEVLKSGTMWLGIELSNTVQDLNEMIFYFDIKNNPNRNTFLNLLPAVKLTVEGIELPTEEGFTIKRNTENIQIEDEFNRDKRIEENITTIYERHFKTISTSTKNLFNIAEVKKKYPSEFSSVFLTEDIQNLSGNCLWVKAQFPVQVNEQMLSDIYCNINCFPVVNKKHNEFTFRLSQNLNIVPLQTPDHFISVKHVNSNDGFEYTNNPLTVKNNYSAGSYTLRQGGIERFDKRNALETISYLIDLLRDESAAFSLLGNDFLSGNLKQLNQIISLMEQSASRHKESDEQAFYLMVNPRWSGENLFVSFWTTNGEFANGIKAGNPLNLYSDDDVQSGSIVFLTSTSGGREMLDDTQRLQAFKQSLVSRGRVVTEQDYKMFCMNEVGTNITDVQLKKGFAISDNPSEGYINTIDVVLRVNSLDKSTPNEWSERCSQLAYKLKKAGTGIIPVRVFTEQAYIAQNIYSKG